MEKEKNILKVINIQIFLILGLSFVAMYVVYLNTYSIDHVILNRFYMTCLGIPQWQL
jgi:hypothetical protein